MSLKDAKNTILNGDSPLKISFQTGLKMEQEADDLEDKTLWLGYATGVLHSMFLIHEITEQEYEDMAEKLEARKGAG